MIRLGLTGRIGAGKSTVLDSFARLTDVMVLDCDRVVHHLYRSGEAGARRISKIFPDVLDQYGNVNRRALGKIVFSHPEQRLCLESAIHPLVEQARRDFFFHARRSQTHLAVIEYSLLFETSAENEFDTIAAVTAPETMRRQRTLNRPGIDRQTYDSIANSQVTDAHLRADFVIDTASTIADTHAQVQSLARVLMT